MAKLEMLKEEVVYFSEAHAKIPGEPTYSTVYCWWKTGRKTVKKKNVKLEAVKLTRGMATSMEAYSRFIARINDA